MEEVTVKVKEEKSEKQFTEEDVQQKLVLYQLLERQGEALKQQLQMIEQRMLEINSTKEAVDNIQSEAGDIMIPLGSGIYTKGQTTGELITDLGSGIMLNKNKADVKKHIQEMSRNIENAHKDAEEQVVSVVEKMNEIAFDIQKMNKGIQQK